MSTWFVTFGGKYDQEPHPSGLPVDPRGWVEVIAPNKDVARALVLGVYGQHWAFMYPAWDWRPWLGGHCFARIVYTDSSWWRGGGEEES